ncbi:glycoside hydrolase family 32 protein [Mucilaginibacter sp.]|uniref:glycoside hydrolase family 32 protein n=1 Tax=Mucilaginibacter sp. TaxID=1882438 RepID=UPI0035BBB5C5
MNIKQGLLIGCMAFAGTIAKAQTKLYHEPYRLQAHFSPQAKWMNDPNGMVYYKGTYHLFFQHYPKGTVWGPMHWGHAVSKDMIHWKQMPIALYPDKLGYIFSGSVVVDEKNTSGLGTKDNPAMVAIFTHHDPKGEKLGAINYQNQSLAYSLDQGKTWLKYKGNPVLKNPGIKDFRDPKVFWYAPGKKWIMSLAVLDHITFYSSPDLKTWTKQSDFGQTLGAHGGVWECPDLIPLKLGGKDYWALLVSINPGGTNGGSATQYFVGEFDGSNFKPVSTKTKWIDYGPDNYAGVTWGNTGNRKVFLGWMSNWLYANEVPTVKWRNAMTIPRELSLEEVGDDIYLASNPVKELKNISAKTIKLDEKQLAGSNNIFSVIKQNLTQYKLKFRTDNLTGYAVTLANESGEKLILGFDKENNRYYLNRTNAGRNDFSKVFTGVAYAPRVDITPASDVELIVDASSIEMFADGGLSNLTGVFFPKKPFTRLSVSTNGMELKDVEITPLKSIW